MIIESADAVLYTAVYLLPGFIINEIISSLVPFKRESEGIKVLRYIGYSVLNFALWIWIFWLINKNIETEGVL